MNFLMCSNTHGLSVTQTVSRSRSFAMASHRSTRTSGQLAQLLLPAGSPQSSFPPSSVREGPRSLTLRQGLPAAAGLAVWLTSILAIAAHAYEIPLTGELLAREWSP
jgi:hypothetical protein